MDVPLILMYSFFALVNIKIFLSTGIISYFRKVYSERSLRNLSQLLVNCFLPVYGVLEVARMATPSNMEIFWILIISVILSMLVGYYSAKIFQYLFKLDLRISSSFALLCCLPSIGTLPLVLGRAFCFPGGPLEGDVQCSNILGYMMINYLVFQIALFLIGFNLIAKDANYGYVLDDKMSLCWHIIVEKIFKKNYFIKHIFRKYIKDKKLADKAFEEFDNNNKLIRNDGEITYKFISYDNDEGIEDNRKYYFELRKSQQMMMPFFIKPEEIEEKKDEYKIEGEEEEASEYLQKFVEPQREFKEDDFQINNINRNSSIRMAPSIKLDSNKNKYKKNIDQNITENNEIDGLNIDKYQENYRESVNTGDNKNLLYNSKNGISGIYFDSKGNSVKSSKSQSVSSLEEAEINPENIKLENVIIKKSSSDKSLDSQVDLDNPTIKKIAPLIIDEYTNLKKKKIKEKSSDLSEINIRNIQSEFFHPKPFFAREHSIQFQISKRDDHFAKSLAMTSNQEKRIHENLQNFLLNRRENIKLKPDPKSQYDFYLPRESLNNITISRKEKEKKLREMQSQIFDNLRMTSARMGMHKDIFDTDINRYYSKMFRIIKENLNITYENEFELEKSEIMKNLHDIPPKFPFARGIEVNRINIKDIDIIWADYLISIKKLNYEFELHSNLMNADIFLIINKIHSPAVVGTILGLVIGISGMRNILFSTNHYITNLVEGILVFTRATVPFLYVSVGVSFVTIRGFSLDLAVSKKHMLLGIIIRFIIVPGFGLLWTWIWTEFYGGSIKESKVFRISIFIPFCVPSSANLVIITNLLKYFIAESNLLLVGQNITLLVSLTILYLIYFVAVGM